MIMNNSFTSIKYEKIQKMCFNFDLNMLYYIQKKC